MIVMTCTFYFGAKPVLLTYILFCHSLHYYFALNFNGFKTLSRPYSRTTWSILMKFRHITKLAMWSLYTNFQVILKFYIKLGNLSFKGHRHLLWSCEYPNKLKLLHYYSYKFRKQNENNLILA